jgi:cell division protein FtsI (penicillin-binding protein 3)
MNLNSQWKFAHKFLKNALNGAFDEQRDSSYRGKIIVGIVATCSGLILTRYAFLSFIPSESRDQNLSQFSKQYVHKVSLQSHRESIVDTNGEILANSVLRTSLYIIPNKVPNDFSKIKILEKSLGVSAEKIRNAIATKKDFVWLRRKLSDEDYQKIGPLQPFKAFIGTVLEPARLYPNQSLASHLIGYVGSDNQGLEGLERQQNEILSNAPEYITISRDARGKSVILSPDVVLATRSKDNPLQLTIDSNIQRTLESYLKEAVVNAKASAGNAIVVHIPTREVLAISSVPDFNLNSFATASQNTKRFRAVMDGLELGSVLKPFVVAFALEHQKISKNDVFFCENGKLNIPGGALHDDHPQGKLTVSEIVKYSSNICTYRIAQKIGRPLFAQMFHRLGFSRGPGSGFGGEWKPKLHPPENWSEMRFANMSFGQGIALSPLQITRGLVTLAAGGTDLPLKFIKNTPPLVGPSNQFVSLETSKTILKMMTTVVEEDGTGTKAALKSVTVAGKTGTAQKFDTKTKSYAHRVSSFIGVFPAENPIYAVTVIIDEPKVRPAYGGLLAGPVFSKIGNYILDYHSTKGLIEISSPQLNQDYASQRRTNQHAL